jgi:hypothetical protein
LGKVSSDELRSGSTRYIELYDKGMRYIRETRVDEAEAVFKTILAEDPEFAPAHFGLGCVYAFRGLWDGAEEEWERAVEIDPDCGQAHYALAWIHYNRGDREGGYGHVSEAIESGLDLEGVRGILNELEYGTGIIPPEETEKPSGIYDFEKYDVKKRLTLFEMLFGSYHSVSQMKVALGIVFLGLTIRFFSFFFVAPIDFRWESYHYWQIAYYTLHVGTEHFRMWDLGGMEYFWGPFPIWFQSILLWIFRTTSMMPFRIFNTLIGCATVFLAYRIGLRYGDATSAKVSAMIAAVNPILIFNSIIGMEETLGVFFMLLSLLVISDRWVYGGLFLGIASLCRIEFWPLSLGIVFSIYLFERGKLGSHWFHVLIGWMIPLVPYMIHLQLATGNAIYPFYWNFLGNIVGVWNPWYVTPLIREIFIVILIASIVGYFTSLKYRRRIGKYYIILITAIGFMGYHGIVYAVSGTAPLFERFFVLDSALISCLAGIFFIKISRKRDVGIVIAVVLLTSYTILVPYYVEEQSAIRVRNEFTDILIDEYSGGRILCDVPMMTYRLIHQGGISHIEILGSLYANYQSLETALEWLQKENATYLIKADPNAERLLSFFDEYDLKDEIFIINSSWKGLELYSINQTSIDSYLIK